MAGLRGKALVAYLLVCVVWGSTYLFIRIGVAHLPPFLFAGVRFLVAGLLLTAIVLALRDPAALAPAGLGDPRHHRDPVPLRRQRHRGLVGAVPGVRYRQRVRGRHAALDRVVRAVAPGRQDAADLADRHRAGASVSWARALLAGITPGEIANADLRGPAALTFGSACWALGSVYWKRHPTEVSPYAASAVQMTIAGAILTVFGLSLGEAPAFHLQGEGLGAMVYLILVGSLVGYTAYGYALEHGSATVVGTYAYVNPVVAVLLGWLVLHEPVTGRMLAAMALILGAVVWIQLDRPARARSGAGARPPAPASGGRMTAHASPSATAAASTSAPPERPYATATEVERVVAGFRDGTLPQREWTHRAHLTVALWYATHHAPAEALDLVRAGILRLNAAHGVITTPTRGYHETITRFYMRVVGHHVRQEGSAGDWARRANRFIERYGSRELPLRHYTEARLKSVEARTGWVEPDVMGMP